MRYTPPPADLRGLRLRQDQLERLCNEHGLETPKALAEFIGMHLATVHRALRGDIAPGAKFIAATCLSFGVTFDDLYELVPAVAA
jgi:hypothetical protein